MRFKRLSIAVAAVAATTAAGVGYAAVPGSDGTIHACYDNVSRPQGEPGVSGRVVVTGDSARDSSFGKSVAVYCPPGKRVIGGGARISGANDYSAAYGAAMTASWPHNNHDPATDGISGWNAGAQETGSYDLDWRLHAYAICASVAA